MRKLLFLFLLGVIISCVPAKKEPPSPEALTFKPNFAETKHQIIFNWQDKSSSDSLYQYLQDESEEVRYLGALAFGSNRDSSAIPKLIPLLADSSIAVRIATAYALGQIGKIEAEKPLTDAFLHHDSVPGFQLLNGTILEALGKCGSSQTLKLISETSTYVPSDTLILLGQARGILQFMLRNITNPQGTAAMISFLNNPSVDSSIQAVAAYYLHRGKNLNLEEQWPSLLTAFKNQKADNVRMFLVTALGKTKNEKAFSELKPIIQNESEDYRVRINAIKALQFLEYTPAEPLIALMIQNQNHHIALTAAEFFLQFGQAERGSYYEELAYKMKADNWEAYYTMFAAAQKHIPTFYKEPKEALTAFLKSKLEKESNLVIKRKIILALGYDMNNMVFLKDLMLSSEPVPVRSAAVEAMGILSAHPEFNAYFKTFAIDSRNFISKYLLQLCNNPRSPLIAAAASVLSNPENNLKIYVSDSIDLKLVLDSLKLPAQIEDYVELNNLMHTIKGTTASPFKPLFNHPIEWVALQQVPDTSRAIIKTSRGDISIELYKNIAPGTVLSFHQLIEQGFYRGKIFHRVVPNFVIQGGCTRGDGFGSLDFTLRSELPPVYYESEGLLGMASAGADTESQQFFITHSPTPHLTGKYTIFGKVKMGMDIVHQIRAGDIIEDIVLLNNNAIN
jgi:cyclophilin family peptidyl-prolyl cis-trans isomerase/HEAT repeat protein